MKTLPADLLAQVETAIEGKHEQLIPYAANGYNSRDHLILVAVPIARDVITSVLIDDANFDRAIPWIAGGKEMGGCWSRNSRIEALAAKYANQLVDKVRT